MRSPKDIATAVRRYEKRVHVKNDGRTETTYWAIDGRVNLLGRFSDDKDLPRPITQQSWSMHNQERFSKCVVVVTAESGVQVRFG